MARNRLLFCLTTCLAPLFVLFLCQCSKSQVTSPVPNPADPCFFDRPQTIVILGSSMAKGVGASKYDSCWAGRLTRLMGSNKVVNLAQSGYITAQVLPNYTQHPKIDPENNVDAALKHNPTCIIISMTTNDIAQGIAVKDIMDNIATTVRYAREKGVRYVVVTTPFPRKIDQASTQKFLAYRDEVLATYDKLASNIFDPLADADHLPRSEYLSSDKLHPNDTGNRLMFRCLEKTLRNMPCQ